jgi:hypothetical protein
MSENSRPLSLPPFASAYRASGLLLHLTSRTSPYGIGDLKPAALLPTTEPVEVPEAAGGREWRGHTGVDGLGLVICGCACDGCTADLVNHAGLARTPPGLRG